ncbi:hypothetical protein [Nocardia spumae]|uniref:hypothetical protein n=1 Tax=Nocardia spumae TaxID=2887190 RepID=UPI001D1467BE|nr:hypothetical protein [Nocardia spumae]
MDDSYEFVGTARWGSDVPEGYNVGRSTTYRVPGGIHALPTGGDVAAATRRLQTAAVRPLDPHRDWTPPTFLDLTPEGQDTTPLRWEDNIGFWEPCTRSWTPNRPSPNSTSPTAIWRPSAPTAIG